MNIVSILVSILLIAIPTNFVFLHVAHASPVCEVKISGDFANMYTGQLASFEALVSGATSNNYSWIIEGPVVKDYDDNVYNSTSLSASQNLDPPTPLAEEDLHDASISFYWQMNETDPNRSVSVTAFTADGQKCEDSKTYHVAKGTDISHMAEDFYVQQNHPLSMGDRNTTRVLQQHQQWHIDFPFFSPSYSDNGDLFFDFHRIYLSHFDAWRTLFGYPKIVAWNPATSIPEGLEIDHDKRAPDYATMPLPAWFRLDSGVTGPFRETNIIPPNTFPVGHPFEFLNGRPFPCEETDAPHPPFPTRQQQLIDFEPDQELLGCGLTHPYHNTVHGEVGGLDGDMNNPATAPIDPIFWRFHKFIDGVSVNRFFPDSVSTTLEGVSDITSPRVFSQNPFRLNPYITSLPVISEQERHLFGTADAQAVSAEFDEPVIGVKPVDFTVNGYPAKQVSGQGKGPYVFIGFEPPDLGPINITFSPGNITDIAGNNFEGASWQYVLIENDADNDNDGIEDGLEANVLRTNPTIPDTDRDGIPDGLEATTSCLNPLVSDSHSMKISSIGMNETGDARIDSDNDGLSNLDEFTSNDDPCSTKSLDNTTGLGASATVLGNNQSEPLIVIMKHMPGLGGGERSLSYSSLTGNAIIMNNGNESVKKISNSQKEIVRSKLNNSGFFDTMSYYTPLENGRDSIQYVVIATSNGKLHGVYWTDTSRDVPDGLRNLPYILTYLLDKS